MINRMPNLRVSWFVRFSALVSAPILALSCAHAALDQNDILFKLSPAAIESQLPAEHPANYYLYAGRLMKAGDLPDALRWFYIGQLRYRVYLKAHPGEDSSAFGALNQSLGRTLNKYGALHRDQWLAAIDGALAWDDAHDNAFTPKDQFASVYALQRAGLLKLKNFIEIHSDGLQAAAKGHQPMPFDWPALVPITTAKDLEGVFAGDSLMMVTHVFLVPQPPMSAFIPPPELELTAISPTRLSAVLRGKQGESARGELEVICKDGAASCPIPNTVIKDPRGIPVTRVEGTIYLRRNAANELVVEREEVFENYHEAGTPSTFEPHNDWERVSLRGDGVPR